MRVARLTGGATIVCTPGRAEARSEPSGPGWQGQNAPFGGFLVRLGLKRLPQDLAPVAHGYFLVERAKVIKQPDSEQTAGQQPEDSRPDPTQIEPVSPEDT